MSIKTPSIQNQNFYQSIYNNRFTWVNIFEKLMEIAVSAFSWSGFPNTIDTVYLERSLITTGKAVYFKSEKGIFRILLSDRSEAIFEMQ